MEIKPDFESAKETAISVMRDREKFWSKQHTPKDVGPLVSYLMVIGIAPFLGYILMGATHWFMSMSWALGLAVSQYISALVLPLISGAVMSIVANVMNTKGKFLDFATIATYAATPGLLAGFLVFVPVVGGLLGFLAALFGLYLLYLGLVRMLKMKSEQVVIFLVVYFVVWFVIAFVMAAPMAGGAGMWAMGRGVML